MALKESERDRQSVRERDRWKGEKNTALHHCFWKAIVDGSIRTEEISPLPTTTTITTTTTATTPPSYVSPSDATTHPLPPCFTSALRTSNGDLTQLKTLEEVGGAGQIAPSAALTLASIRHVSGWKVSACVALSTSAVCWRLCKKVATRKVRKGHRVATGDALAVRRRTEAALAFFSLISSE